MKGVILTPVSSGFMLALSFSPAVIFCKSVGQAIIIDDLFGFSSIRRTVNIPFLIFFEGEENLVYFLGA